LRKVKEESDEKINNLNNEKLSLMLQLNTLDKTNSQLAGHKYYFFAVCLRFNFPSNYKQKIDHLTKLKEENNKLKEERVKLQEKLNKSEKEIDQFKKVNFSSYYQFLNHPLENRRNCPKK